MKAKIRHSEISSHRHLWVVDNFDATGYVQPDGTAGTYHTYDAKAEAQAAFDLYLEKQKLAKLGAAYNAPADVIKAAQDRLGAGSKLISVSHKDYMSLSDAYDKHSRNLMSLKGEEYAIDGDFLAMENRLAGMLGDSPEYMSLVMAGKHITALGIILLKNGVNKIKLEKLDERIRDACNLLKITAAFVHAKQDDFSLHLGKEEKQKEELDYQAAIDHETGTETKPGYGGEIGDLMPYRGDTNA